MTEPVTVVAALLGGGGIGAFITFVAKAWGARHTLSSELSDTTEFRNAVDDRVTDAFEKITTQDLIDKRVDAGIDRFRTSVDLQKIIDDRFEHKMRSATMVFSSGLEVARSEIASLKTSSDLYNQQHVKQHDELMVFLRRMEKKVDAATVATAELRGKVGSLSDASTTDDESVFPERSA